MNSFIKTLIFLMLLSLTIFSISLSMKKGKSISTNYKSEKIKKKESFRDFLFSEKIIIFQELEENWCRKFNCNSG
ncbi:MAG: hypothetical protein CK427_16325 [Leptospira sp.]|nr:MAG: hypothetical protein CK427_16325 [Leptospira sp.]